MNSPSSSPRDPNKLWALPNTDWYRAFKAEVTLYQNWDVPLHPPAYNERDFDAGPSMPMPLEWLAPELSQDTYSYRSDSFPTKSKMSENVEWEIQFETLLSSRFWVSYYYQKLLRSIGRNYKYKVANLERNIKNYTPQQFKEQSESLENKVVACKTILHYIFHQFSESNDSNIEKDFDASIFAIWEIHINKRWYSEEEINAVFSLLWAVQKDFLSQIGKSLPTELKSAVDSLRVYGTLESTEIANKLAFTYREIVSKRSDTFLLPAEKWFKSLEEGFGNIRSIESYRKRQLKAQENKNSVSVMEHIKRRLLALFSPSKNSQKQFR